MQFTKQTAIVSGATGALGSVIIQQLSSRGARIAAPVSSEDSARKLRAIGIPEENLFFAVADLTREEPAASFVRKVEDRFGRVEILVNAAGGYSGGKAIEAGKTSDLDAMLDLNLKTAYHLCRFVLPGMKKAGYGRIVNIASMPAVTPAAGSGPYAMSKRAVITLTETIAMEQKGTGVTANVIAPSIIRTDANMKAMPGADHSRWVPPEEIAELVAVLCSKNLPSLSGNTLKIYGGVS